MRTDLAIESCKDLENYEGVLTKNEELLGIKITHAEIKTEDASRKTGRDIGRYITLEVGHIADMAEVFDAARAVADSLRRLLADARSFLVIGLGNTAITPDALGPATADRVLATRHLSEEFKKGVGLTGLKPVSVLSPGVLGQTGMESAEVIRAVCDAVRPDVVIAVDALAAADSARLGNTIQLSNAGINPGSGVGNRRRGLNKKTLGVPVIAVGIPTVTDSAVFGEGGFIVTPREIDMLISRASELLSHAINQALQPEIDEEILLSLV